MSNGINSPYGIQIVSSSIGNGGTQKLTPYPIYASANGLNTLGVSIFAGDPVGMANVVAPNVGAAAPLGALGTIVPLTIIVPEVNFTVPVLGVFQFCNYYNTQNIYIENSPYWPANTQVKPRTPIIAYINDDPNVICKAQISTSTNNFNTSVFLFSQYGTNANLAIGGVVIANNIPVGYTVAQNPASGNTNTGQSVYYVNASTISTAAAGVGNPSLNVKIIGLASDIGGNIGQTTPNSLVLPNLIPGVSRPFMDVLFKFNNHVYGSTGTPGPHLAA